MKEQIELIVAAARDAVAAASDEKQIDEIRVKYLGKKGEVTSVLKGLGAIAPEERKEVGALANEVRAIIEEKLNEKKEAVLNAELNEKLKKEVR